MTIEDLIHHVRTYNECELDWIRKAYEYARFHHDGQYRQSGEEYITHPLNVAYILSEMHADKDTICAALLHDTLEDTSATKEEIAEVFNANIANLVDGVTKISKMNGNKEDEILANRRKIITSIQNDIRIIIIKLADRLHNMRTLSYKTEAKQRENALETMDIFVPFAYYIGAYRVKSDLEDLSLRYLYPDVYQKIVDQLSDINGDNMDCLNEMQDTVETMFRSEGINCIIKKRTKNIYGVYNSLLTKGSIWQIHDLLSLKIILEDVRDCYLGLYLVHSKYKPINNRFKDYISNPKKNMYQSIHTTVFGPRERLVQTQIRTSFMDLIASFGLTAYWDIHKGEARNIMQAKLEKFPFYQLLDEVDKMNLSNQSFVGEVKRELFAPKIYVYDVYGNVLELPFGSTPIDVAYKLNMGDIMVGSFVNDEEVSLGYQLKTNDRVKILTSEQARGPSEIWLSMAYTSYAKRRIMEKIKK